MYSLSRIYLTFISLLIAFSLFLPACNRQKDESKQKGLMPPEHAKIIEKYRESLNKSKNINVAKVNGVAISMYNLVAEMNTITPQYLKPGQAKDPELEKKIQKEALDRLIYRELADQEAISQGLKVDPAMIAAELQKMKTPLKTEDAYRQKLANSGLTEEDLKKQIERNILVDMIIQKEIFDKVHVDPELVKKTYAREKGSYKGPSGKIMSFEEARPLIEEKLMRPLVQKREDQWVDGLRKAAKIEITTDKSAMGIHSVN